MSIEAMKQALEALEYSQRFVEASANAKMLNGWGEQLETAEEAITSLRQAIAEAEKQEPVAVVQDLDEVKRKHLVYECGFDWKDPLYTHPQPKREWVGLTDEEIEIVSGDYTESEGFKHGARWALDQLKEKNT